MIQFRENWTICADEELFARRYDNLTRRLDVVGDLPDGWDWAVLVKVNDAMDVILLEPFEGGAGVLLTAEQLSEAGYYTIQVRGTRGDQVKHTNVIQVFVPDSLSGTEQWPTVPSEFAQMEKRIRDLHEHPPVPGDDGYWMLWNPNTKEYEVSEFELPERGEGSVGPAGADGKSAYAYAVEGGFTGSEEDFAEKLAQKIPTETADLLNNSGFITKAVADLANYYRKSEVYTQEEVNSRVSAIPKFSIQVVDALPASAISATTIYLLKSGEDLQNLYTEYIYTNNQWEKLGEQAVDLTGYATESFVKGYAQPVGDYARKDEIPEVPVKSVNGKTGAVMISVPAKLSDLTNDVFSTELWTFELEDGSTVTKQVVVK